MNPTKPITQKEWQEMTSNIVILPELKAFIPPLTVEERMGLEQSIKQEGVREPLLLWEYEGKNILIDGHNRYEICKENNISFDVSCYPRMRFYNLDAVKTWMIGNQLGKRNLTEEQKSYLRGKQYQSEKKEAHRPAQDEDKLDTMSNLSGVNSFKNIAKGTTAEKLAEQHKVSAKTIQRDEKFAEAIDIIANGDAEVRQKILQKEVLISKKEITEIAQASDQVIAEAKQSIKAGQKPQPIHKTKRNSQNEKFAERKQSLQNVNYEDLSYKIELEHVYLKAHKDTVDFQKEMIEKYSKMDIPFNKYKTEIPNIHFLFFRDYINKLSERLIQELEHHKTLSATADKFMKLNKERCEKVRELEKELAKAQRAEQKDLCFVQKPFFTTPKNNLESDIYAYLSSQDSLLIDDVTAFFEKIKAEINNLNQKHSRCKAKKVSMSNLMGSNFMLHVGDYYLVAYKVKYE